MNPQPTPSLEPSLTIATPAAQLRCRLQRLNDRWQTVIELLIADAAPVVLLASIEGDADTDWPSSPPMQDCQQLPSMPDAILGTGMAGTAHWSMAVEKQETKQLAAAIVWDIAARLRREIPKDPDGIGSDYQLQHQQKEGTPVSAALENDGSLRLSYGEYQCSLFIVPTGDPHPTIRLVHDENETNPPVVRIDVGTEAIEPPRTIRWKYGLRWIDSVAAAE